MRLPVPAADRSTPFIGPAHHGELFSVAPLVDSEEASLFKVDASPDMSRE